MSYAFGATSLSFRPALDSALEESLIERCRRRDLEAFRRIVSAYQTRVHGFVRRIVTDQDDAQDITQEVFIRAYQAMDRFDGRSSLRTWLFRIAHNLCIDSVRKNARNVVEMTLDAVGSEDETFEVPDERWNPESIVMTEQIQECVERAISDMSEKLRTVLLLHDREQFEYEAIAQMVSIPVGTVKSRLFLARSFIQDRVREYLGEGGARTK